MSSGALERLSPERRSETACGLQDVISSATASAVVAVSVVVVSLFAFLT